MKLADVMDKVEAVSYTHLDVYKRQGLACGIWENELLCFIFRQKLHEFKKNISVKPFKNNKN